MSRTANLAASKRGRGLSRLLMLSRIGRCILLIELDAERSNAVHEDSKAVDQAPILQERWLEFKRPISKRSSALLGLSMWVLFFGVWEAASFSGLANPVFLPAPSKVFGSMIALFVNDSFIVDVGVSVYRILFSFTLACLISVPLGILMGSFARIEAFVNPFVSAWRYLPAPAFIPLLLMWLGTGEEQKIALLFIGVIWFLITIIMDHVKAVRTELIETSMTLGGNRWQILWTVIVPASLPNIVVAMRQMLAVSWTYLVIAEIVASTNGIGAMMMRARRFLHVDQIMVGIIVIGILGLIFDYIFRWIHRRIFTYIDPADI
jgi:NitT/TauT family transport system permease protein